MMLATKEEYRDKNIVTFAPSGADRYLSTGLFAPEPDEVVAKAVFSMKKSSATSAI